MCSGGKRQLATLSPLLRARARANRTYESSYYIGSRVSGGVRCPVPSSRVVLTWLSSHRFSGSSMVSCSSAGPSARSGGPFFAARAFHRARLRQVSLCRLEVRRVPSSSCCAARGHEALCVVCEAFVCQGGHSRFKGSLLQTRVQMEISNWSCT